MQTLWFQNGGNKDCFVKTQDKTQPASLAHFACYRGFHGRSFIQTGLNMNISPIYKRRKPIIQKQIAIKSVPDFIAAHKI